MNTALASPEQVEIGIGQVKTFEIKSSAFFDYTEFVNISDIQVCQVLDIRVDGSSATMSLILKGLRQGHEKLSINLIIPEIGDSRDVLIQVSCVEKHNTKCGYPVLVYINRLGGWSVLSFPGRTTTEFTSDRDLAQSQTGEFSPLITKSERTITLNTSIVEYNLHQIADLVQSAYVFLYEPKLWYETMMERVQPFQSTRTYLGNEYVVTRVSLNTDSIVGLRTRSGKTTIQIEAQIPDLLPQGA